MWLFAIIFVSTKITPLNGLSKWSLLELFKRALQISSPKRSPNEVSKFRTGSSLLGACWKIVGVFVGSLIYGIHGIISFQNSSLIGLSKWTLQKTLQMSSPNDFPYELSKWTLQMSSPNWDLVGVSWVSNRGPVEVCWESTGHSIQSKLPADFQWTPLRLPLDTQETHQVSIWRAHLERPFKKQIIPWILQIRLPLDSWQTPLGLPLDSHVLERHGVKII